MKVFFALTLTSLLRHGLAQENTDTPANQTVVVTTEGTSTFSQTFIPTSLSAYSTVTAATTVTTTDAAGAAAVVAILAGGLAWWAIPPPAGGPTVNFPTATPTPPRPSSTDKQTTEDSTKITTTSSFSNPSSPSQTAAILTLGNGWQDYINQKPIMVDDDAKACGFPNDDEGTVNRDTAHEKIGTFCNDKKGAKVVVGEPLQENYNVGAGVMLNITVQQNEVCSFDKEQTLDQADCDHFLHQALDDCETSDSNKHGGIVSDECFKYMLHPEDDDGELTCTDEREGTGINRDEALKNIADFCKKYNGIASSGGQGNLLSYWQDLGDSQATISVMYGDAKGCLRGGGPGANYVIEERSCVRFLSRTIDACDTDFKGSYGKFGGKVISGCGVFKFESQVVEKSGCPDNPDYQPPVTIKPEDAERAIDSYCNADLTVDPNYKPDNEFHQFQPEGTSYDNFVDGLDNYVIRMSANFLADQSACHDPVKFNTKGDECKRKLKKVIETCPDKAGGFLTDKTNNGCVAWMIYGQSTSN